MNSRTWDWLDPTGTELRKARLCRQGRELSRQWRDLCGPSPGRRARRLLNERESSEVSSSDHSGEKRRLINDTEGDSEQGDTSGVLNDLGSDDQQPVEPTRRGSYRVRFRMVSSDGQGEGWRMAPSHSNTGSSTRNTFCGERRQKVP